MNTEILSLRLQTVVKYIPSGSRLADIGSDHAYLPCHVVQKGIVPFAIAGEVVEGPFQSAVRQVKHEGLESKIIVRKGDGLEVVELDKVDCITICGMGGALISAILERGKSKLTNIKRLILQPNVGSSALRKWLINNSWQLTDEEIISEDGKVYEILVAKQGDPLACYDENIEAGLLLGPILKNQQNRAFKQKWQGEMENWHRILQALELAGDKPENKLKSQELLQKIKIVEGELKA